MRIPVVLSLHDLPAAELQAGVLDGELVRVGEAYCAIDTIIGVAHRAASIATEVAAQSIAERFTAAWVYGALYSQPRRLQLCVNSQTKVRPFSTQRCVYREVVLGGKETITIGGLAVTTPMRTAIDIVRTDSDFSDSSREVVRSLATFGLGFDLVACVTEISLRKNLPHKQRAITRLELALN